MKLITGSRSYPISGGLVPDIVNHLLEEDFVHVLPVQVLGHQKLEVNLWPLNLQSILHDLDELSDIDDALVLIRVLLEQLLWWDALIFDLTCHKRQLFQMQLLNRALISKMHVVIHIHRRHVISRYIPMHRFVYLTEHIGLDIPLPLYS